MQDDKHDRDKPAPRHEPEPKPGHPAPPDENKSIPFDRQPSSAQRDIEVLIAPDPWPNPWDKPSKSSDDD